jgi:hypothetical protein
MGATGFESLAITSSGHNDLSQSPRSTHAKSGAISTENLQIDSDLQRLIVAWPTLPESLRSAILAIVLGAESSHSPRKDSQ